MKREELGIAQQASSFKPFSKFIFLKKKLKQSISNYLSGNKFHNSDKSLLFQFGNIIFLTLR